jgi:hypothetical protein
MIKKYLVEHDTGAGMTVEVDHSLITDKELHELNNFWSNAKDRLNDEGGNILNTVLKLLLERVLSVQFEQDLNTQGVINAFDWDYQYGNGGQEGYPKLDGSSGIKLLDVIGFELLTCDMSISEVA